MATCLFRYLFDIKLGLPEDCFRINHDGIDALVLTKTIAGANLTSYSRDDFSWITKTNKDDPNLEAIDIKANYTDGEQLIRNIKYYKNKDSFSGGLIEPSSYTVCEVMLPIPDKGSLENKESLTSLKEQSVKILTHFISGYRYVTQESDIYIPNMNETKIFEVLYSESDLSSGNLNFNLVFKNHYWGDLPRPNKALVPPNKLNTFVDFLKEDSKIPIHLQLLMDAKEQGSINKNYEVSIVKINTAFEVLMQTLLSEACEQLNILELPTGNLKSLNPEKKSSQEAISDGGLVQDLLKKYLYIVVGHKNILSIKEYNKWYDNVYKLRNLIVYKGSSHITETQAMLAFSYTVALMEKIINEVNEAILRGTRSEIAIELGL